MSRTIVLSANTSWFITNFCGGLVRGLYEAGYEPVVIAPDEPGAENRMRELGVERFAIQIDRAGLNPLADLGLLISYKRLLGRIGPAAYLGFTIKPNIYGAIAAASLGIPAVPNVSGLGTAFLRQGLLRSIVINLYRFAFRRASAVFFQNQEDRRLFIDRAMVRPGQARILPGLGVDLTSFEPTPLPEGRPTFLFVGRLLRDKGVIEFVEAARSLRSGLSSARFQLLGPIDEANRSAVTRKDVQSWVNQGVIEYLGETADVRSFVAAATAVVLPSYREGMPRALLEGAAMARPLIATDVAGCRDVVENGVNGYLCAARDSRSLADAMRRLACLPYARQIAMGEAGRAKVQELFSEELVIKAYLDVLTAVAPADTGA